MALSNIIIPLKKRIKNDNKYELKDIYFFKKIKQKLQDIFKTDIKMESIVSIVWISFKNTTKKNHVILIW